MKKSLFISLSCFLFSACTSVQDFSGEILKSEEVLKRAAKASMEIESFSFDANLNLKVETAQDNISEGKYKLLGRVNSFGEQMSTQIDADISLHKGTEVDTYLANAEMRILGPNELYLKLNSFESSGGEGLIVSEDLLNALSGQWWSLNSSTGSLTTASVAPDPRLLNAQSQVVKVEEEFPISRMDDSFVYHYAVTVDKEKLVSYLQEVASANGESFNKEEQMSKFNNFQAEGQLWIDTDTFVTRKIEWELKPFEGMVNGKTSGNLQVIFSDWNNVKTISPPDKVNVFDTSFVLQSMVEGVNMDIPISDEIDSLFLENARQN